MYSEYWQYDNNLCDFGEDSICAWMGPDVESGLSTNTTTIERCCEDNERIKYFAI